MKQTKYTWNIMCNHCHKIIGKDYNGNIIKAIREQGKAQAKEKFKEIIEKHRWNDCKFMKNGCVGCMMKALIKEAELDKT